MRDECLYNDECLNNNPAGPHGALQDRRPAAAGALWVDSREPRESTAIKRRRLELEITGALPVSTSGDLSDRRARSHLKDT